MTRAVLGIAMFLTAAFGWGQEKDRSPEVSKSAAATQTAAAASAAKPVEGVKPISALSWLVGGVWTADASKLGPGMKSIETRYQWADNNAYIRFNTHFVFDKGAAHTYDGNFFWNPTSKTLAMWYMDAENSITEGPVQVEGVSTKIRFRAQDFEGKMADMRVVVTRKNNDDYHWALQEMAAGEWKELAALEYLRTAGS
ncbi:MAG TPA: hypothetical protein VIM00_16065 [Candidatus Acidoferrum sp.]|jgi:hypothetical protein